MTALRRMPRDNPIPMTASQYLRWLNRKTRKPLPMPTDEEIAAFAEKAGWNKPGQAKERK